MLRVGYSTDSWYGWVFYSVLFYCLLWVFVVVLLLMTLLVGLMRFRLLLGGYVLQWCCFAWFVW